MDSPDFPIMHRFRRHGSLPLCCAAKVHQEATNHLTRQRPPLKAALDNPKFGVWSPLGVHRLLEPAEYVGHGDTTRHDTTRMFAWPTHHLHEHLAPSLPVW